MHYAKQTYYSRIQRDSVCNTFQYPIITSVIDAKKITAWGESGFPARFLGSLPPAPVPEYVNYQSKVRKWCTIQVAGHSYSVPSCLIGKEVQIRLYADWVEVYYKGHRVERMERVRGEGEANVNYRHVIGSLVRKPGAFARYRFREQLFPIPFRYPTSYGRCWPRCFPSE